MSDERPTSMGAALASASAAPADSAETATADAGASQAESPAATSLPSDTASAEAAPTAPPVSEGSSPGPIPYARFQEVIRQRNDYEKRMQDLAWAQQVAPDVGSRFVQMIQRAQGDPVEFASALIAEIQAHPEHGARLRSLAAKALRGNGSPEAPPEPEPDMKVPNESGGHYVWRSAENQQQWLQWHQQQWLAQVRQELEPLQRVTQETQHEREQMVRAREAIAGAKQTMADIRQRPYFEDHKPAITERFKALMVNQPDDAQTARFMLNQAYLDILTTQVIPKLSGQSRTDLLQTLTTKAAASTQNPAAPAPTPMSRPKSFAEALRQQGLK